MTLPQLAALDADELDQVLRNAHREVADAHGASSIFDAASFRGCPAPSEATALARIDAVADGLGPEEARAGLEAARAAADTITADLASGQLRDVPSVTRAHEFLTASRSEADVVVAELLGRAARDQYLRGMSSSDLLDPAPANLAVVETVYRRLMWPVVCASDAANAEWLTDILATRGWFSESGDGELAASAAWLMVQHADGFPDLQRTVLGQMAPLVESGDIPASQYAYLHDRVSLAATGRQRYGTQMYCAGPQDWRPRPLEAPEQLDRLREDAGLPPMADYAARGARFCTRAEAEDG
ncbi:MAG: hypothetical protein ACI8U3_002517 [Brevundimonas sp.]|jgi:hypothetical protein